MGISNTRTILALLLAISDLQEDLTSDEKATLVHIGNLLIEPSDPLIKEILIKMIHKNNFLNQRYQEFTVQINKVNDQSLQEFLTTVNQSAETRGHFRGQPDLVSDEIMNVTVIVFAVIEKQESVTEIKKLSILHKLKNFINNFS